MGTRCPDTSKTRYTHEKRDAHCVLLKEIQDDRALLDIAIANLHSESEVGLIVTLASGRSCSMIVDKFSDLEEARSYALTHNPHLRTMILKVLLFIVLEKGRNFVCNSLIFCRPCLCPNATKQSILAKIHFFTGSQNLEDKSLFLQC